MSKTLSIALAQLNPLVGDLAGNAQLMRDAAAQACALGASVIVFPELVLTGYPPEDLLLFPDFIIAAQRILDELISESSDDLLWVVGTVGIHASGRLTNDAVAFANGQLLARYVKQSLPNYGVFDEQRYFVSGNSPCVVHWRGVNLGLLICEDCWQSEPALLAKSAGAEVILSLHASPYEVGKGQQRLAVIRQRVLETGLPFIYVNQVGGQDSLVFDGGSFVMDVKGTAYRMPLATPTLTITNELAQPAISSSVHWELYRSDQPIPDWSQVWQMLCLGLKDYVRKNGFSGVLLGLSGGIDSALVLALAVDALGADAVEAVMMPFIYTSEMSQQDAALQANDLGVKYTLLPIEPTYEVIEQTLAERFTGLARDVTEENLQARIRGLLLMALSNKTGKLLLSTSNKSESAMGYATLYGDMNGGLAPLKDVPKTWVYALATWRNQQSMVIPKRVIDRPPSAELRPNQTDQDSLPAYEVLDAWLSHRIEANASVVDILDREHLSGNDSMLQKTMQLLRISEYKRRQSAPGIKITSRSFDKDWRMPITNGWKS
jgi:NAD+ synthase (glutamine-hydrolysing)